MQRCPQLVTHLREELGLCQIGGFGPLGAEHEFPVHAGQFALLIQQLSAGTLERHMFLGKL